MRDPRNYQIAVLATLLVYGRWQLHFDISWAEIGITLSTVLLTQLLADRLFSFSNNFRSPLISGLSLCLLLRADVIWVYVLAGVVTIASKFLIRQHHKHIFNPTAFGIVIALTSGQAWIAAGQWGSVALLAFLVSCLGIVVAQRAARFDVSAAFLVSYGGLLLARLLWLGDPFAIYWHQIENGALILFSFFMISDPKTTPDSRIGRLLFAPLVAGAALFIHFGLYRENGLFWALVLCNLCVPLIDRWLPGPHYQWPAAHRSLQRHSEPRRSYEAVCT